MGGEIQYSPAREGESPLLTTRRERDCVVVINAKFAVLCYFDVALRSVVNESGEWGSVVSDLAVLSAIQI